MPVETAFAILAGCAMAGALSGGIALAGAIAPFRAGRSLDRPAQRLGIFAASFIGAMPILAALLGAMGREDALPVLSGAVLLVLLFAGPAVMLPPRNIILGAIARMALLALAVLAAAGSLYGSALFRGAILDLHDGCNALSDFDARADCRAHVNANWALPASLATP